MLMTHIGLGGMTKAMCFIYSGADKLRLNAVTALHCWLTHDSVKYTIHACDKVLRQRFDEGL